MKFIKKLIFPISLCMLFLAFSISCYAADDIHKGSGTEINATNSSNGYIQIKSTSATTKNLKVMIEKSSVTYTYDLNNTGVYDTYPLQMGNGKYTVKVLEKIADSKYSVKQTATIDVKLSNDNAPFLVSNQYVDYTVNSEVVKKAKELTAGKTTDIEKLDVIYDFIISNISYDTAKAETVKSGYLPKVDDTLSTKKGICFDYASMMAAMLRSQSIPAKLVTGYSSQTNVYHAWNEVYLDEQGWIVLNKMYFDGNSWKLMDSTFASTAKQAKNEKVVEYMDKLIGDGKNYTKKYEY